MIKYKSILLLVSWFVLCGAREPFKPRHGSIPFLVYFPSRYRGLCVGVLVSRTAVLTAAVCVTNPTADLQDTRPINVVTSSTYRHPRRGIRNQVTKILLPKLNSTVRAAFLMQVAPALLLLKYRVPDIMAEIPTRALGIDWKGEIVLSLQEECMMPGWHFFYKGDKIFPVHKFLLQRNIRVQFLNIVKKSLWCDALSMKFEKAMTSLGIYDFYNKACGICVKDPDRTAQPCHGMYGAPLLCRGRAVGMLLAPDAQWTNCTGFSNIIHLFSSRRLRPFMTCISSMFKVEQRWDWSKMKRDLYDDMEEEHYDYMPAMYDRLNLQSDDSTSSESE